MEFPVTKVLNAHKGSPTVDHVGKEDGFAQRVAHLREELSRNEVIRQR